MKRIVIILLTLLTLTTLSPANDRVSPVESSCSEYFNNTAPDSINEKVMIEKTVEQYYIKGLKIRDFHLIREICIQDAILYSVRDDGSLNTTSLDKWSERFDPDNPPFGSLEYQIKKIDYEGSAVQVKILFVVDKKTEVYDFLNLLKVGDNWRIVNIIDY